MLIEWRGGPGWEEESGECVGADSGVSQHGANEFGELGLCQRQPPLVCSRKHYTVAAQRLRSSTGLTST